MEKFRLNQEMEDRLLAFFNGELDEGEERQVGEWISESPENREAYEALLEDYLAGALGTGKCSDSGGSGKRGDFLVAQEKAAPVVVL